MDLHNWQDLGAYKECRSLGPNPNGLHQNHHVWSPTNWVLISQLGDSLI